MADGQGHGGRAVVPDQHRAVAPEAVEAGHALQLGVRGVGALRSRPAAVSTGVGSAAEHVGLPRAAEAGGRLTLTGHGAAHGAPLPGPAPRWRQSAVTACSSRQGTGQGAGVRTTRSTGRSPQKRKVCQAGRALPSRSTRPVPFCWLGSMYCAHVIWLTSVWPR